MNQEQQQPTYYWIRIFDYNSERDQFEKGVMLDEFYTKNLQDREHVKQLVKDRYCKSTSEKIGFAKKARVVCMQSLWRADFSSIIVSMRRYKPLVLYV